MKSTTSRSAASAPHSTGVKRTAPVGLRKGKIRAAKASATEIRRAVGVTPADERVAARALRVAAAKPKSKARGARSAKESGAKTRSKPTKKR